MKLPLGGLAAGVIVAAGLGYKQWRGADDDPAHVGLVVVPLASEGDDLDARDVVASEAVEVVTEWYGRHGVEVVASVQRAQAAAQGSVFFGPQDSRTPCSDAVWQQVLQYVEQTEERVAAAGVVVVVVMGGVIRSPDGLGSTYYGRTCRVGQNLCSESVLVEIPNEVHVDGLVAVDWRPSRETPLQAVLAHEVGHAAGLAHEGDDNSECQFSDTDDDSNIMARSNHIAHDAALDDFSLTPEQSRWIRMFGERENT